MKMRKVFGETPVEGFYRFWEAKNKATKRKVRRELWDQAYPYRKWLRENWVSLPGIVLSLLAIGLSVVKY